MLGYIRGYSADGSGRGDEGRGLAFVVRGPEVCGSDWEDCGLGLPVWVARGRTTNGWAG